MNVLIISITALVFLWAFIWIIWRFCMWVIGKENAKLMRSDIDRLAKLISEGIGGKKC